MKIFANHFYNFGFNITHISSEKKEFHRSNQTVLKSPSHRCEDYLRNRQQLSELHSFDWENASGLGVMLGFNNLRALDIDGSNDLETINHFLSILNLPLDYEWVVRSGSKNGFHILFYCDIHRYNGFSEYTIAFASNLAFKDKFQHIELRWFGHLVLPPSIHPTYNHYQFLNNRMPIGEPSEIKLKHLEALIKTYCSENRKITWITSVDFIYDTNIVNDFEEFQKRSVYSSYDKNHYIAYYQCDYEGMGIPVECNFPKLALQHPSMYIHNFEDLVDLDEEKKSMESEPYYFFFDTETTGVPLDYDAPASKISNWPRIIQIAFITFDNEGNQLEAGEYLIKPNDFVIPADSTAIHGITNQKALLEGLPLNNVLNKIYKHIEVSKCLVAHNINFDSKVLGAEFHRNKMRNIIEEREKICTMLKTVDFCSIKSEYGNKWPKLSELYFKLFENYFDNAHDAMSDIKATAKCFWELKKLG